MTSPDASQGINQKEFDIGFSKETRQAILMLLLVCSAVIYTSGVIFVEIQFASLVSNGMNDSTRAYGWIAIFVTGGTALILPLAIHMWFSRGMQRIFGYAFYAVDFLIMMTNTSIERGINVGMVNDSFILWWQNWGIPLTIVTIMGCWAIVWALDERSEALDDVSDYESKIRKSDLARQLLIARLKSNAIQAVWSSNEAKLAIQRYVVQVAPDIIATELGTTRTGIGYTSGQVFSMSAFSKSGQETVVL